MSASFDAGAMIALSSGRVYVCRRERPGSLPVLLVHGLGTSANLWTDVVRGLAGENLDLIAVDIMGHGRSDKPPHLFTIRHHARVLAELLRTLELAPALIVGNSMGAQISVALAVEFPESTAGVLLIGCPAFASLREKENWLVSRSSLVDLSTGAARPRPALVDSGTGRLVQSDTALLGQWMLNSIWAVASYDLMGDLGTLRRPLKVVYGAEDWLLDSGRNLLSAVPGAQAETIPGAGHHPPLDSPVEVAASIAAFSTRLLNESSTAFPGVRS